MTFGKDTIECKEPPFAPINIRELLEGIFSGKAEIPRATKIQFGLDKALEPYKPGSGKKLFISYAHKDEKWKDQLVENLATLRNQELIGDWTDRQIETGLWDPQIEAAMQEADIFLLLITRNFLSSTYISSKEITTAYARFKAGKAIIFPVICDACAWELQPITREEKALHPVERKELYLWLGKFQAFPKDAKPIKKWPNKQDGFVDVINQLKKYL
ncbi:toll/interleukin-1 receptor domain-containing protein [Paraflavitalea speifideaquila]|uniref:toll/interleukin-1 receptor domain-containing protein n=1 Tax=Paraflavitalea speifideaquila TaxID=3076558 RepID=UPI0028E5C4F4|nr:toll/interleukin-1 receptor domain-containing protein [Paraflavitalea speifideiaquila]